jgi:hypothetical protein
MQKLRSKPCHIATSINTRTQRKGEEREPYMDIALTISVTAKEACAITGEPHTADAWFETKDGKFDKPLFKNLAPYRFTSKFENSLAVITVGVNQQKIDCGNCTLNKLVFEPLSDGRTALKLKIQCPITSERTPLFLWLDHDADVQLQFGEMVGDDAQEELPLEVADGDDVARGDDDTPEQARAKAHERERRIAQQIQDDRDRLN